MTCFARHVLLVLVLLLTVTPGNSTCLIGSFAPKSIPVGNAPFLASLIGSGFPDDVQVIKVVLFSISESPAVEEAVFPAKNSTGSTIFFHHSGGSTNLTVGKHYGAKIVNASSSQILCTFQDYPVLVHGTYSLTNFFGDAGSTTASSLYNVAGKQTLTIEGSQLYAAPPSDVFVRFRDENGNDVGLDRTAGEVVALNGVWTLQTRTPPIPKPIGWFLGCADQLRPAKSETCIPDLHMRISFSLDGGITFSNEMDITFGYVPPLKLAFLFVGPVTDFGWTMRLNEGRTQLEKTFGATINASTYYESLPEGEFESFQENVGSTFSTNTQVPETFVTENGIHYNTYYPGIKIMKQLCDEDFDFVVTGSFGFTSQSHDITSGYQGCSKVGDGSSSDQEHKTYFLNTGGYHVNELLSNGFGKIYQMRYLTGIVAGYELKKRQLESEISNREFDPCVGYIAAYPLPEVQRGMNAFLIGCQEVFPECKVKTVWSGVWHNAELETEAAKFLWHEGKCEVITQHSDTVEPQLYYKEQGGVGIGYNSDARSLVGDSVLISSLLQWEPVFSYFIDMVRNGKWANESAWLGVDQGAAKLADFFSPLVPADVQELVLRKKAELESLHGEEAFRAIFCGDLKKRWVYEKVEGGNRRKKGCGFQPSWKRLETPEPVNPKHFRDADGNQLGAGSTPSAEDCLYGMDWAGQALLRGAYPEPSKMDPNSVDEDYVFSDYLLDGIELFEPMNSPYGVILSEETNTCFSAYGTLGDRFYVAVKEYPKCDGTQWKYSRDTCNPATMKTPIKYEWVYDNETGSNMYCGEEQDIGGKYSTIATLPFLEEGPSCDFVPWGAIGSAVASSFATLGVLFFVVVISFIWRSRQTREVRLMQPLLMIFMAFGGLCLNASTFTFIGEHTESSCLMRIWTFNLSFDMVFAFLWSRIYRVFLLFSTHPKVRRPKIRDTDMVKVAAVLIAIDALVLLLWTTLDPPVPVVAEEIAFKLPAPGLGTLVHRECSSKNGTFMSATTMFKIILVVSACYLVYSTKDVPASFVEHKFIIFGTYNTAVFSFIVFLATMMASGDPTLGLVIHSVGIALGSTIVIGSLVLPRIAMARRWIVLPAGSSVKFTNPTGEPSAILPSIVNHPLKRPVEIESKKAGPVSTPTSQEF